MILSFRGGKPSNKVRYLRVLDLVCALCMEINGLYAQFWHMTTTDWRESFLEALSGGFALDF